MRKLTQPRKPQRNLIILCSTRYTAARELQTSPKCRILHLHCFLRIKGYLFLFYSSFLPSSLCSILSHFSCFLSPFLAPSIYFIFRFPIFNCGTFFCIYFSYFSFTFHFTPFSPVLFYSFLSADIRKRIKISLPV